MSPRIPALALALAVLPALSLPAKNVSPRQLKWEELSFIVGKTVSVVMPGGHVITGKTTSVESDALVVRVTRTADAKAYPKGPLRVPRATLHTLQLQTKGVKFRIVGTVIGAVAGLAGGVGAAIGISGGILSNNNPAGATAALIGITAGVTTAGYLLGNAADRRSETIEILP